MISGIAHVNILVPPGSLDKAVSFYSGTLGLSSRPVPELQKGTLAWYVWSKGRREQHDSLLIYTLGSTLGLLDNR